MNLGKKARLSASIANSTKIFGIMGGTVSVIGVDASTRSALNHRATRRNRIPLDPVAGLSFMTTNKLLSVNPQSTGGVGKMVLLSRR